MGTPTGFASQYYGGSSIYDADTDIETYPAQSNGSTPWCPVSVYGTAEIPAGNMPEGVIHLNMVNNGVYHVVFAGEIITVAPHLSDWRMALAVNGTGDIDIGGGYRTLPAPLFGFTNISATGSTVRNVVAIPRNQSAWSTSQQTVVIGPSAFAQSPTANTQIVNFDLHVFPNADFDDVQLVLFCASETQEGETVSLSRFRMVVTRLA